jgi:hypothetical protein
MSGYLSVLVPTVITSAMLTSSTATVGSYTPWSSTTNYTKGLFCYSPVTQRVYQSLVDSGNTNKDPTDVNNRAGAVVYWLDTGPTNPWAMFDKKVGTATTASGGLTVVLQPGAAGSLYVAGISNANGIAVTLKDAPGGSLVYSYNGSLEGSAPDDYLGWAFDPFEPQTDLLLTDIPFYGTGELTVSLAGSGLVGCGALAVGDVKVLGQTLADAEAEPISYAYIDTDQWGNTDIIDGPTATNLTLSAITDTRAAGLKAQRVVESLLGQPAFWFATDTPDMAGLRTWGLGSGKFSYRSDRCSISLSVKGLI